MGSAVPSSPPLAAPEEGMLKRSGMALSGTARPRCETGLRRQSSRSQTTCCCRKKKISAWIKVSVKPLPAFLDPKIRKKPPSFLNKDSSNVFSVWLKFVCLTIKDGEVKICSPPPPLKVRVYHLDPIALFRKQHRLCSCRAVCPFRLFL